MSYAPATVPTFYFIGVTTGSSSIMKVFPAWAEHLGLGPVRIQGIDLKVHDDPERYREVVRFIKGDPLSLGALVTTHKLDLLRASRELFDQLDPYAQLTGEISCLAKRHGRLLGYAKDPISAGLALEAFLPADHWSRTGAEALILGAGGASIALTLYMLDARHGGNRPSRLVTTDRNEHRLAEIRHFHEQLRQPVKVEYHLVNGAGDSTELLARLAPGSLVVNATGLGKDAPGSPLAEDAPLPKGGFAWEFNYRGDLVFLEQARARATEYQLHVEDGWIYFIHGWTRVIAEVFDIEIPTRGPAFDRLAEIAAQTR